MSMANYATRVISYNISTEWGVKSNSLWHCFRKSANESIGVNKCVMFYVSRNGKSFRYEIGSKELGNCGLEQW